MSLFSFTKTPESSSINACYSNETLQKFQRQIFVSNDYSISIYEACDFCKKFDTFDLPLIYYELMIINQTYQYGYVVYVID